MEYKGLGLFITFLIVVAVVIAMLPQIAQSQASITDTTEVSNQTFVSGAESATVYITNFKSISDVVMYNGTGDLIPASNYTVTNDQLSDGALAVGVTTGTVNAYANETWSISGTAEPLTYGGDSGTRAIAGLIVLLSAIGVLGFAVWAFGKQSDWF